jgi:hypothetical protein
VHRDICTFAREFVEKEYGKLYEYCPVKNANKPE